MNSFPCYQCGLCCRHVHLAAETRFLDRGDGTCSYYDALTKSCAIYAQRPDICRVDRLYTLQYSKQYTWSEFVALNLQVCASLNELNSEADNVGAASQTLRTL